MKRLGDTRLSEYPIKLVELDFNKVPVRAEKPLLDLRRISKGIGVIPKQVQNKFRQRGEEVEMHEMIAEAEEEHDELPADLNRDAFWHQVFELRQVAKECFQLSAPKVTWNSEVHSRILRLSLRGR